MHFAKFLKGRGRREWCQPGLAGLKGCLVDLYINVENMTLLCRIDVRGRGSEVSLGLHLLHATPLYKPRGEDVIGRVGGDEESGAIVIFEGNIVVAPACRERRLQGREHREETISG